MKHVRVNVPCASRADPIDGARVAVLALCAGAEPRHFSWTTFSDRCVTVNCMANSKVGSRWSLEAKSWRAAEFLEFLAVSVGCRPQACNYPALNQRKAFQLKTLLNVIIWFKLH